MTPPSSNPDSPRTPSQDSRRTLHDDDRGTLLAKVSQQLLALEKRDWDLWLVVVGTGILVAAGLLTLMLPAAFLRQGNVHFELEVSRELFLGLVAVLVLFNTYVINRRLELRRARESMISTSIQSELVRLQSFTDPLTEVYNRRSLDQMANRYINHAKRIGKPLTFMLVDADNFKDVNTLFGHLTGDFVIAELAGLMKNAVRGSDAVIRYGGDEFLVILADAALEGAQEVIARISKFLDEWNRQGQLKDFQLTVSVGMSQWSEEKTLDQMLSEADRSMYAIKQSHKHPPAKA